MGGLLTYGIPNMKLSKDTVQRRVDLMEAEGITFRCNEEVGADAAELANDFDATVLAMGSTVPSNPNPNPDPHPHPHPNPNPNPNHLGPPVHEARDVGAVEQQVVARHARAARIQHVVRPWELEEARGCSHGGRRPPPARQRVERVMAW